MSRPVKRSLTLHGHATSVTLEPEFWRAFRDLADERGVALNALAAEIDAARAPDTGLASAIRVHLLAWAQGKARREGAQPAGAQRAGGIE